MKHSHPRETGRFDARLIQKPHRQPALQRGLWGIVGFACWLLMAYLLLPLATLVLWLLGFRIAWQQLYEYQDHVDPFLLMAAPILLLGCALLLISWAEYNRLRFGRHERRGAIATISQVQIAQDLGATPEVAEALRRGKSIVLHMDAQARPLDFTLRLDAPVLNLADAEPDPARAPQSAPP